MKCRVFLAGVVFSQTLFAGEVLETINVYGRDINLVGQSLSASQGVVTKQEIELRPVGRTGDILELVPGMVVTQHSGSGKANQYYLRGFNLDHGTDFSTHLDGMPVNMRSHGHGQGYTDLNFIIPEVVADVKYRKGSYYADAGDFSSAGAAFFQTQNALDNNVIKYELGEHNYNRLVTVVGTDMARGNLIAAFEYQSNDGPWDDVEEDLNKKNLLIKYLNNGFSLSFMVYDNEWNSADQIPSRAVEQGVISAFGSIDKTVGGESSRYSLNAQWQEGNNTANIYWINYDMNLWSNFTYYLDDSANGDQFNQQDERDIVGGNYQYESHLHVDGKEILYKLGSSLRLDLIDKVALNKSAARKKIGAIRDDSVDELSLALFAETIIPLNERWRSVLGLRYDYYDFSVDSNIQQNLNGFDLNTNNGDKSDGLFSAKGSVIYSFAKDWETYFSIGQGFHSNDARGTTIKVDPINGDKATSVDPLVKSLAYEWGVRGFYQERLNTSLALWYLELDSELLFVGDAGNTEESGASERYGVELTAYYQLNEQWMLDLEYAWTDATFQNSAKYGKYIPGAVDQVIQAGVSYVFNKQWQGSLRYRYYGERPLVEDGSVKSDDAKMLNAKISYSYQNWGMHLHLLNITDSGDHDVSYLYESQLAGETKSVEDVHYHVFEPRTARIAVSYKF